MSKALVILIALFLVFSVGAIAGCSKSPEANSGAPAQKSTDSQKSGTDSKQKLTPPNLPEG